MEMIDKIKILLGINDDSKDDLLALYIEQAQQEFMDYCRRDDIPTAANQVIIDLVVLRYNRQGTEGYSGQSFSGVREDYLEGYPKAIEAAMGRYRKVKLL